MQYLHLKGLAGLATDVDDSFEYSASMSREQIEDLTLVVDESFLVARSRPDQGAEVSESAMS